MYLTEDPGIFTYEEGKKLSRKGYWFPYWAKYLAWFLVFGTMATSMVLLIFYGLTFGLIKCYLWMTAVVMSFLIGIAFIQPVKIFMLSFCFSQIIRSRPTLQFKKIPVASLQNSYDKKRFFMSWRKRLESSTFYTPLPKYRLENRAQNIRYHMEQRKLFVDVFIFLLFVLALCYMILIHKSWASYYSTEVVKNLAVEGSYMNSISFMDVKTYDDFLEYLNNSLLPSLIFSADVSSNNRRLQALFLEPRSSSKSKSRGKRKIAASAKALGMLWQEDNLMSVSERFSRSTSFNKIFDRSWTMDSSVKLIGKPRMRQIRVKNNTCAGINNIKPREDSCFAELSLINQEFGNFTIWWKESINRALTPMEQKPWLYQTAWETGAIYLIAKFSAYPGGGYILDLAKDLDDSRVILDFMNTFHWIDARTRAVIIEFTLYCVNVNLFSVVHLIAERSAAGYFIPSYQIDTGKYMFLTTELEEISVVMMLVFVALLLLFMYREAIRIDRTSLRSYLSEGNPAIDILIIILGITSVLFIFLRSYYVSTLLKRMEKSQNYEFISFSYAALWDKVSTFINATLVSLAAVKVFKLLRFRVVFLQLEETLKGSSHYFFALGIQLSTVLVAFSLLFYLLLGGYDHDFSSFGLSLSTIIGRAFCLNDHHSFDYSVFNNTPWFLAPLFFILFIIIVVILMLSLIISVVCYHITRVKSTKISNKYNALAYLRHMLTANDRTDILRLKGGGTKCAKFYSKSREKYTPPPKHHATNVIIRRRIPCMSQPKIYDFGILCKIDDPYRFEAMKHLTYSSLHPHESNKNIGREMAMKTLVGSILDPVKQKSPEKFYKVIEEGQSKLVSIKRLIEMKKTVDKYGLEKMISNYEGQGLQIVVVDDGFIRHSRNVTALKQKLSALQRLAEEIYKRERIQKIDKIKS